MRSKIKGVIINNINNCSPAPNRGFHAYSTWLFVPFVFLPSLVATVTVSLMVSLQINTSVISVHYRHEILSKCPVATISTATAASWNSKRKDRILTVQRVVSHWLAITSKMEGQTVK